MKTLILPGFSIKNKVWAEEISRELSPDIESEVVYWDHWKTGVAANNWIEEKIIEIINESKGQKVNILAKSIGTLVTVRILEKDSTFINKIIMCGIPLEDLSADDLEHYEILKGFPKGKIIYIQNEYDNHGSHNRVYEFLKSIDNGIQVISKPREDHEYPYPEVFRKFLLEEKQEILKKLLKELNQIGLSIGEYAITGSGPLAIRNLREPHDIDIIVLPSTWDKYKTRYPVRSERFETIQIGNITILGAGSHFANPNIYPVEKQIAEAEVIDSHPYIKLETLRLFKRALGREKDLNDLKIIDSYIETQEKKSN